MSQEQANLARNFPAFMDELSSLQGADLHIAVVSSDLGAGAGTTVNNDCNPASGGDRGVFCSIKGNDFCARCGVDVTKGRFLRTVNPNFTGNIRNVFTCMSTFGTGGCGFEHQIGALARSLAAPENAGFLRPDAYFAFIVLTDEDDCSGPADSQLYATDTPGQDSSLRCNLAGHVCNGQHNTGAADVDQPLSACAPADDGGLIPVPALVGQVLTGSGKTPDQIIAAGIFGWPLVDEASARYQIGGMPNKAIRPICQSANGSAAVGLRVKKFVESFPNHSIYSICQDDFREAVRRIAQRIRVTLGDPCITAPLVDIDPATPALDPDCSVLEQRPLGNGRSQDVVIPRCKGGDTTPCWNLIPTTSCIDSGQSLVIDRKGQMPAEGTRETIRCLTCVSPGGCR
jgi:hypothetical protein